MPRLDTYAFNTVAVTKRGRHDHHRSLIQSNFLIQRRSAKASASPIDLLMDHQVDFIEDQIDWKWCLLALSGNATIVKLRRNEFVKYLKMNVAAQTGSEYDFVRVTSIRLVNLLVHYFTTRWPIPIYLIRRQN